MLSLICVELEQKLEYSKIIVTESVEKSIEYANMIAPEHLELAMDNANNYIEKIKQLLNCY